MTDSNRLSLSGELHNLHDALQAARLVLEAVRFESLQNEGDWKLALPAVSAVLNLSLQRLQRVLQGLSGERDPTDLEEIWNTTSSAEGLMGDNVGGGGDVVLSG